MHACTAGLFPSTPQHTPRLGQRLPNRPTPQHHHPHHHHHHHHHHHPQTRTFRGGSFDSRSGMITPREFQTPQKLGPSHSSTSTVSFWQVQTIMQQIAFSKEFSRLAAPRRRMRHHFLIPSWRLSWVRGAPSKVHPSFSPDLALSNPLCCGQSGRLLFACLLLSVFSRPKRMAACARPPPPPRSQLAGSLDHDSFANLEDFLRKGNHDSALWVLSVSHRHRHASQTHTCTHMHAYRDLLVAHKRSDKRSSREFAVMRTWWASPTIQMRFRTVAPITQTFSQT
jgi:hypothetical protein